MLPADPPHATDVLPSSELPVDLSGLPSHLWVRLHNRERIQQKLRLSLTEHCNLGCFFCHNEGQRPVSRAPGACLSVEELEAIARVAVSEGVTKIKLTGGEPLLYRCGVHDIVELTRRLAAIRGNGRSFDLSVTTNGSLLPEYAGRLRDAGLDRATVSITTLDSTTFSLLVSPNEHLLTRSIAGLRAARDAGLAPLKINMALYDSARRRLGNLRELPAILDVAAQYHVAELRLFTLIWHESFTQFEEFYHFFSPQMREELRRLLTYCGVDDPRDTVQNLADLAVAFAHRVYPKVEFGVQLGSVRLAFEALKYARLPSEAGFQEGPYAMRLGADGALRATLQRLPSYALIEAVRRGLREVELRRLYRVALEEMP